MSGCEVSAAYEKFKGGLEEIHRLRREARRVQRDSPHDRVLLNALNRSATVLLCSRIEAYVEDVFVEGWESIERAGTPVESLPPELRVELLTRAIRQISTGRTDDDDDEELASPASTDTPLERRDARMRALVEGYAYLWMTGRTLDTNRSDIRAIARKLNNPGHKNVRGLFQNFGLPDVFTTLEVEVSQRQRAANIKSALQDIVLKRHKIAHGDSDAKPTPEDVARYLEHAMWLCRQLDAVVGLAIQRITGEFPWKGPAYFSEIQVFRPLPINWP